MTKKKSLEEHQLTLTLPWADEGEDGDGINPLARGLDRLLRTGKPIKKIGSVFAYLPKIDGKFGMRWVGTFVHSTADRLIFFPGYATKLGKFVSYMGGKKVHDKDTVIDHLTLEKDRYGWHLTTPNSKDHFGGPRSLKLAEEVNLWFGMSVAASQTLHQVRQQTVIRFQAPLKDLPRRQKIALDAISSVENLIVELHPLAYHQPGPHFYHFSVVVGKVGVSDEQPREHGYPKGSPFIEPDLPDHLTNVYGRVYRLSMPPFCDLLITALRLPGRCKIPIQFSGPTVPQVTE